MNPAVILLDTVTEIRKVLKENHRQVFCTYPDGKPGGIVVDCKTYKGKLEVLVSRRYCKEWLEPGTVWTHP